MFWSGLKSMISSIRYVQIGPKNKAYRLAPECGGLSTKKKVWGPHWKEKVKTVLREQTINILSLQTQITLTNSNTFTHFSHSNTDLGVTVFTLYNGSTSCRRVSCRVLCASICCSSKSVFRPPRFVFGVHACLGHI